MKTQVNIRNEAIELKRNIIFCLRLVEYVKSPFFPNKTLGNGYIIQSLREEIASKVCINHHRSLYNCMSYDDFTTYLKHLKGFSLDELADLRE